MVLIWWRSDEIETTWKYDNSKPDISDDMIFYWLTNDDKPTYYLMMTIDIYSMWYYSMLLLTKWRTKPMTMTSMPLFIIIGKLMKLRNVLEES